MQTAMFPLAVKPFPCLLPLLLWLLCGCKPNNNHHFTVTGKINHAAHRKLYLQHLPYGANAPIVVDSTLLQSDSTFRLSTLAPDEGLYLLVLEKGPQVLLINDAPNVQVALNVQQYAKYQTEGSKASESIHYFLDAYTKEYPKLLEVLTTNDSLRNLPMTDSLRTVIQLTETNQLNKVNDLIRNAVARTNSPAFTFYLLAKSMASLPPEEVLHLAQLAEKKYPQHFGINHIHQVIRKTVPHYALLNQPAPPISLQDTAGRYFGLDSLRGKFVLVQFWASWHKESRNDNVALVAAYQKYKNSNFDILGVSLDSNKQEWMHAIMADQMHWHHVSDLKQWKSKIVTPYLLKNLPFNVLVNPKGTIVGFNLRNEALIKMLNKELN